MVLIIVEPVSYLRITELVFYIYNIMIMIAYVGTYDYLLYGGEACWG
jgi:hypothetical protein